jgi:hypothetical protein
MMSTNDVFIDFFVVILCSVMSRRARMMYLLISRDSIAAGLSLIILYFYI